DPTPLLSGIDVQVDETAGTATVQVNLVNGSERSVTVAFSTQPGTADDPADYQGGSGTLTWAPGETGPKSAFFPLVNDLLAEEDETFQMLLSNATNALLLTAAI